MPAAAALLPPLPAAAAAALLKLAGWVLPLASLPAAASGASRCRTLPAAVVADGAAAAGRPASRPAAAWCRRAAPRRRMTTGGAGRRRCWPGRPAAWGGVSATAHQEVCVTLLLGALPSRSSSIAGARVPPLRSECPPQCWSALGPAQTLKGVSGPKWAVPIAQRGRHQSGGWRKKLCCCLKDVPTANSANGVTAEAGCHVSLPFGAWKRKANEVQPGGRSAAESSSIGRLLGLPPISASRAVSLAAGQQRSGASGLHHPS